MITTIKDLQKIVIENAKNMGLEAHIKRVHKYYYIEEVIVVDVQEYTNYEALDLWS